MRSNTLQLIIQLFQVENNSQGIFAPGKGKTSLTQSFRLYISQLLNLFALESLTRMTTRRTLTRLYTKQRLMKMRTFNTLFLQSPPRITMNVSITKLIQCFKYLWSRGCLVLPRIKYRLIQQHIINWLHLLQMVFRHIWNQNSHGLLVLNAKNFLS